jgi:phosphatidylinositol 4-kinase B
VCYILQIKDRHNGNILIDIEGHIIHIDFGFLLSNAPGKGIKFEQAPFKLTQEMVEVLGGIGSKRFNLFRELMRLGFMAI